MGRRRHALPLILATCMVLSTAAVASRPAFGQSKQDKAKAGKLLDQGNDRFERGDYAGALQRFQDAYATFASPKILLNIGEALRKLQRSAEAAETFETFLVETASMADVGEARVAKARAALAELRPRLGRVRAVVSPPSAQVTVDGRAVGEAARLRVVYVEPGPRVVRAEAEGYQPGELRVTARANEEVQATLTLEPIVKEAPPVAVAPVAAPVPTPAPAAPEPRRRLWTWIAAGSAGALLAGGALVGVHASGLYDDLKDASATGAKPDADRFDDLKPRVEREQRIANSLLIAGGVAAVGAVVLFYVEGRPPAAEQAQARRGARSPTWAVAPRVGDGAGVDFALTF